MIRSTGTLVLLFAITTAAEAQNRAVDQWLTAPVDDATYATYLEFFRFDDATPFDAVTSVEADGDLTVEHVTFTSTPGERVTARLYHPVGAPFGLRSAIYLHGGGPLGKDGSRANLRLLARAGWTVFAIDMQHYGERNTGLLTTFASEEKGDRLYNRPGVYLAWMTQNVKDVGRSFDYLVDERGVAPDRVVLVGFSRGGTVSMVVGGAEPRLAGVVILHGGHFDFVERGHSPAACPANYIGRIAPRPLFMINPTADDDFFPETSVHPLQRLAGANAQFRWNDETSHGILDDGDRAALIDWLRRTFP
jgi:dienelactone hydrolase